MAPLHIKRTVPRAICRYTWIEATHLAKQHQHAIYTMGTFLEDFWACLSRAFFGLAEKVSPPVVGWSLTLSRSSPSFNVGIDDAKLTLQFAPRISRPFACAPSRQTE